MTNSSVYKFLWAIAFAWIYSCGAASQAKETHISAALLIPMFRQIEDNLRPIMGSWDHENTQKYGKAFTSKRTLLGDAQSPYHMTLVSFEFSTQNLSEQYKKQLQELLEKKLQKLVANLPGDIPTLQFKEFTIFKGESRTEKKIAAQYLVAVYNVNPKFIEMRNNIIDQMLREFPDAYVREDFAPHFSLVRMAPDLTVSLPQAIPEKSAVQLRILPEKIQISVQERLGRSNQNFGSRLRQLSSDLYSIGARVI